MAKPKRKYPPPREYPDSDGKPIGETPEHVENLLHLIHMLRGWLNADEQAYVGGDNFLYYERGNPQRHVVPDVFVVRGILKTPPRRCYLVWEETKAPDLMIELTSAETEKEDRVEKFALYRDILQVQEYFLFDPLREYLEPPLQGFRLQSGRYAPIQPIHDRLPSEVLGLHLEREDWQLRLYNPHTRSWLLTPREERQRLSELRLETMALQEETRRLQEETEELRRQQRNL